MGTTESMTTRLMALNAQRGGNKGWACCQPLAEYDRLTKSAWLHAMVEDIRKGDIKQKGQLPFRCAHYHQFKDNRRSQKNAVAESFLFQTCIDVDDPSLVSIAIEMARQLNCSDTIWKGQLLHLEYSARKKLHIDIRLPMGMTIEEAQRSYCQALGVQPDESCFSPERIIFVTDHDSEIYRSPEWYAVLPPEELKARREAYLGRGLTIDGRGTPKSPCQTLQQPSHKSEKNDTYHRTSPTLGLVATPVGSAAQPAQPVDSLAADAPLGGTVGGSAGYGRTAEANMARQKNLIAFDLFQEMAGLKQVAIDTEGSRHSSLLAIMSAGASRVMGEEELRAVVAQRMPSFAKERDCQQLIHDFYAKYADGSKPFSQAVMRINAEAERRAEKEKREEGRGKNSTAATTDDSPVPPPMPERLPRLVELLVSRTPDIYKPAVAHAIFPPLASHLWRTTFRYIDNVDHEATLMCALLAGTGAGKNCVHAPINLIMADIRKRDQENLAREKAWKDEVTRKGANKDKRKRPENLIIQEIDADMTNPAFVMRTAEAQEHFLYTSLNEIDQFDALKGQGNQQFRIMCLAFDPGNQYGQTRVGTQSVTERVCVRFNWNASTTIHKGQRYFSKVLTDGPISRINFCTIPEREIGADMPIYGTYGEDFCQELQPYIDNLCRASGKIDCPEAYQLALRLKDENADYARMTQNRIFENLSFRANVIAYLKACVLYVANGCKWEAEMEEFIRWSEQYDLWCKMNFFGEAIAKSENEGEKSSRRGPRNLLQQLPDIFTLQEAESVRLEAGIGKEGTKNMLNVWMNRKYIRRKEADTPNSDYSYSNYSFEKLKFRKDGVVFNV